jgi:hypothetical protein
MKRLFLKALLCLGVAFATVVAGLVFHQNFSWPRLKAEIAMFFHTLTHGDALQVISALTSAPVLVGVFVLVIAAVLLWDIYFRKRG